MLSGLLDVLERLQPQRLCVACDGPRAGDVENRALVQRCRALIEERVTWPVQLQRRYADVNQG